MSSLTDRYVHTVTRRLSPGSRDDVALELRTTIEDTIDARSDGVGRETAEREAIAALGDPDRLADAYRGGGRYLIGPVVYPLYLKVLRSLLTIVVPIAGGLAGLGLEVGSDVTVGRIVTGVGGAMVSAALQVAFWCTLGFAIAERTGALDDYANRPWDPDTLAADPPERQISWSDAVFEICLLLVLLVLLVLLAAGYSPLVVAADGSTTPLFGPVPAGLCLGLIAVVGAAIALASVNLVRGRWDYPAAVANLVLNVAFAAGALWLLLGDNLITEDARAAIRGGFPWDAVDVTLRIAAAGVLVVVVWDTVSGFMKAHQTHTQRG